MNDSQLRALAQVPGQHLTYTAVPPGSAERMGINKMKTVFSMAMITALLLISPTRQTLILTVRVMPVMQTMITITCLICSKSVLAQIRYWPTAIMMG
ncbi:MAG: hypothetical protein V3W04_03265 [Gammaproteobacteria bacterium]